MRNWGAGEPRHFKGRRPGLLGRYQCHYFEKIITKMVEGQETVGRKVERSNNLVDEALVRWS